VFPSCTVVIEQFDRLERHDEQADGNRGTPGRVHGLLIGANPGNLVGEGPDDQGLSCGHRESSSSGTGLSDGGSKRLRSTPRPVGLVPGAGREPPSSRRSAIRVAVPADRETTSQTNS
jgi:hypothetical protein